MLTSKGGIQSGIHLDRSVGKSYGNHAFRDFQFDDNVDCSLNNNKDLSKINSQKDESKDKSISIAAVE
jgi:hypothetical protein